MHRHRFVERDTIKNHLNGNKVAISVDMDELFAYLLGKPGSVGGDELWACTQPQVPEHLGDRINERLLSAPFCSYYFNTPNLTKTIFIKTKLFFRE